MTPEERRVMTILATHGRTSRHRIGVLAWCTARRRDAILRDLRAKGWLAWSGSSAVPTPAGLLALPTLDPVPTGRALCAQWCDVLPPGERRILELLVERYPSALTRESIGARVGFDRTVRDACIKRLLTNGLAMTERGAVIAAAVLFE